MTDTLRGTMYATAGNPFKRALKPINPSNLLPYR